MPRVASWSLALLALPCVARALSMASSPSAAHDLEDDSPPEKHRFTLKVADTWALQHLPNFTAEYRQAARQCLEGKRIWIMGNSVSRHWWYVFRDVLDGTNKRRRTHWDEAVECGRGGLSHGCKPGQFACATLSGCEADAGTPGSHTHIQFLFQQELVEEGAPEAMLEACPELLTINAGGDDIFDPDKRPNWRQRQEEALPKLRSALQAVLDRCPATRIVWRTTTPICRQMFGLHKSEANPWLFESNTHVKAAIDGLPRTRIFDSWNSTIGHCEGYEDGIHHGGLQDGQVRSLLEDYCRDIGRPL